MIDAQQAADLGWTPAGEDESGNQRFELIDGDGNRVQWSIDNNTGEFAEPPKYISDAPAPEQPPVEAPQPAAPPPPPPPPAPPDPAPEDDTSAPTTYEDPPPDHGDPPDAPPDETWTPAPPPPPTAADYAASRPDLLVNWQRAFDPAFANDPTAQWIRTFGSVEEYLSADYGAALSPGPAVAITHAEQPAPANISTPPPVIIPAPAPVILPPVVIGTNPVPVDIFSSPTQTPRQPAPPMTAADYAAKRPDLVVNWERAHDPTLAADSLVQWILSFGTLNAYLQNDYGSPFADSTGSAPAKPTAAQYAAQRPDLLVNWQRAFDPANANDAVAKWIRSFGTVEAYLANDYGAAFSPGPAVTVTVATGATQTPPSTSTGTVVVTGNSTGATTTHRAADNTHVRVGSDKWGSPVYQLIDDAGNLVQWTEFNGTVVDTANLGSLARGTYVPQAQAYKSAGSGGVTVTTHRAADSTHHYVGNDKWGNPVYQLIDEAGNLIQWTEYQDKTYDSVNLLGNPLGIYVPQAQSYLTAAPGSPAPGAGGTVTVTTPAGSKSSALLFLAVAAVALVALRNR